MNIWGGAGAMSQESIDFVTADRKVSEEVEQFVMIADAQALTDNYKTLALLTDN